jgi:hypothetical protein
VCTASWLTRGDRLHLFFNRDELREREPARPPAVHETEGVRWIGPTDGRAGGTWIAANEHGLAVALLNRNEGIGGPQPVAPRSRGTLIPQLAAAVGPETLAGRLAGAPLDELAPFRLLALWRERSHGLVAAWDGERLEVGEVEAGAGLLCSSGLGDETATRARGATWRRYRLAHDPWRPEAHREFHRDHSPEPSAWSVCVHRPEAASVSFTEIELGPERASLVYHDAPPCEPGERHELALAQRPVPADED